MSDAEDRKFFHDLATPMTILKMHLQKIADELNGLVASGPLPTEKQIARIEVVLRAVKSLEMIHAEYRKKIAKT